MMPLEAQVMQWKVWYMAQPLQQAGNMAQPLQQAGNMAQPLQQAGNWPSVMEGENPDTST